MPSSSETKVSNAKITHTTLGYEDHGILTAMLDVQGEGWGQGFGNWDLRGGNRMKLFIEGVLVAVGVESWEELAGKTVRIKHSHDQVEGIGHIVEDRWFYPREVLKDEEAVPA